MAEPVIALLSPGAMGAAVGALLTAHGARVLTSLDGRGDASMRRAAQAGMVHADDATLAGADLILSIVPPAQAEPLARRLLPHLASRSAPPPYVDANALSPESKRALAALCGEAGVAMIDGAIIGPPPGGAATTTFYLAGPDVDRAAALGDLGLTVRLLAGPVGAAAALKMSYAAINKGVVGLAAAALLAADRAGAGPALRDEMAASMPDLLVRLRGQVPSMYPKAYRWVAEMREIAAFLDAEPGAGAIYEGLAQLFEHVAADVAGDGAATAAMDRVLQP